LLHTAISERFRGASRDEALYKSTLTLTLRHLAVCELSAGTTGIDNLHNSNENQPMTELSETVRRATVQISCGPAAVSRRPGAGKATYLVKMGARLAEDNAMTS